MFIALKVIDFYGFNNCSGRHGNETYPKVNNWTVSSQKQNKTWLINFRGFASSIEYNGLVKKGCNSTFATNLWAINKHWTSEKNVQRGTTVDWDAGNKTAAFVL